MLLTPFTAITRSTVRFLRRLITHSVINAMKLDTIIPIAKPVPMPRSHACVPHFDPPLWLPEDVDLVGDPEMDSVNVWPEVVIVVRRGDPAAPGDLVDAGAVG